jgi:hypothetical protein
MEGVWVSDFGLIKAMEGYDGKSTPPHHAALLKAVLQNHSILIAGMTDENQKMHDVLDEDGNPKKDAKDKNIKVGKYSTPLPGKLKRECEGGDQKVVYIGKELPKHRRTTFSLHKTDMAWVEAPEGMSKEEFDAWEPPLDSPFELSNMAAFDAHLASLQADGGGASKKDDNSTATPSKKTTTTKPESEDEGSGDEDDTPVATAAGSKKAPAAAAAAASTSPAPTAPAAAASASANTPPGGAKVAPPAASGGAKKDAPKEEDSESEEDEDDGDAKNNKAVPVPTAAAPAPATKTSTAKKSPRIASRRK